MNTIVLLLPKNEYDAIKDGSKNFILLKAKVAPQYGQRVLAQQQYSFDAEMDLVITEVHTSPGLMKDWYLLTIQDSKAPVRIEFSYESE